MLAGVSSRSARVSGRFPSLNHPSLSLPRCVGECEKLTGAVAFNIAGLYESILPLVKSQVESQIKVRDFSKATVSLQPAEYSSWADARSDMMIELKRPLKAQLQAELAAAGTDEERENITAEFSAREKAIEHDLDHKPRDMHMEISVSYNFLSK